MIDGFEFIACFDGLAGLFGLFSSKPKVDEKVEQCKKFHGHQYVVTGTNSDMTNNWMCGICNRRWTA